MTPALIDTDPGVDDALALLYAWSSPDWRVEALTTVAGNVSVEAATLNARRLLALRQPAPPPIVAVGSAGPAGRPVATAAHYHGEDGLGDLDDWPEPPPASSRWGPDVIVEAARAHGAGLTLVAIGPLTNVALALGAAALLFPAPDVLLAVDHGPHPVQLHHGAAGLHRDLFLGGMRRGEVLQEADEDLPVFEGEGREVALELLEVLRGQPARS